MIYLINLDRRPDRLQSAYQELRKFDTELQPQSYVHRISAVDGKEATRPAGFIHGSGAFGCRESHVKVLDQAIKNDHSDITVFEDDIVLSDTFQEDYERFLDNVPKDWQCLFLGGQHMGRANVPRPLKINDHVVKCFNCHRTHAYRVRGKYIKVLREMFANSLRHIDHTWGKWQQDNRDSRIYAPYPKWLCGQSGGVSDIKGVEKPVEWWHPRFVHKVGTSQGVPCERCGALKAFPNRPCLHCLRVSHEEGVFRLPNGEPIRATGRYQGNGAGWIVAALVGVLMGVGVAFGAVYGSGHTVERKAEVERLKAKEAEGVRTRAELDKVERAWAEMKPKLADHEKWLNEHKERMRILAEEP